MHYQKYNEYINTINIPSCDNMIDIMDNTYMNQMQNTNFNENYNVDLESMYPQTYKIIYPMVCSACDMVQMPVTKEVIVMITEDIYNRVKMERYIDLPDEYESRQRNMFLNDLISVLLIRELIQRRPNFPNRPQHPIRPFWGF